MNVDRETEQFLMEDLVHLIDHVHQLRWSRRMLIGILASVLEILIQPSCCEAHSFYPLLECAGRTRPIPI